MLETWVITVSPDRPIDQTVQALASAGCSVRDVLAEIGVVTVQCEDGAAEALRAIPGVSDVARDTPVDIGPPDAPVTW